MGNNNDKKTATIQPRIIGEGNDAFSILNMLKDLNSEDYVEGLFRLIIFKKRREAVILG